MSDADDYDDVSTDTSGQSSLLIRQTSSNDADGSSSDSDISGTQPLTYLQLGARPSWGTEAQRGDDLLSAIGLTTSTTAFFKDDYRSANGLGATTTAYSRDDGNAITTSTAKDLTSELMTRGGFRLHTDGNLVTTTRGDRVDVVYGNHKLAVLGRTNAASYVESSGGHALREDVSTHARFTSIEWNASRSTWTAYEETTKGNHTSRFQGPIETIYECDEIDETIGRAVDDDATTAPTIAATSSDANEQSDASTKWVNPSSGVGTGWPRAEESPDRRESLSVTSFASSTKVKSSLGAASTSGKTAGTISIDKTVDDSSARSLTASGTVASYVRAEKGATVTDAIGFKASLVGSSGSDQNLHSNWRCRYFLGSYEGAVFETRKNTISGGGKWLQETILDVVGIHITATTGVRLIAPNFGRVSDPAYTSASFYKKDSWSNGGWFFELAESAFFGTSDSELKIWVPTLEYYLARASVCVSHFKGRSSSDHVSAHLAGAYSEIGFGAVILSLVRSSLDAAKSDTGALKISLAGLIAKS